MEKKEQDLILGCEGEDRIISVISNYFDKPNIKKTSSAHPFDFVNDKEFWEVKTRRCKSSTYSDTMVGMNKIKWLKNNNITDAYFVFAFEDGDYYYKYIPNDLRCNTRVGGRWDRGYVEKKYYYYIPTILLKKIS
jgi:hypothetical protein